MRSTSQRDGHAPAIPSAVPAHEANLKRRRFLLALGAGSAATAAAATQAVASPIAQAVEPPAESAKRGYSETEHVRTYYASTRL